MLKFKSYLIYFLPLTVLLTGCPVKEQLGDKLKPSSKEELLNKSVTESIEVSISCNKDTIQDYLDNGWTVVNESVSEVPCTWKTVKATRNCNLERDKGCKITVPDLMGEKIMYTLEKDTIIQIDKVEESSSELVEGSEEFIQ